MPTANERSQPGFHVAARSAIPVMPASLVAFDPKTNHWVQTDPGSFKLVVAAFDKAKLNPDFCGVLVDFDHDTKQAAGWIQSLEIRPDGLWADVEWTALGLAAIQGGIYRRVSPGCQTDAVFGADKLPTEHKGIENEIRWRPVLLEHVSLTNNPLFSTLPPIVPPAPETAPLARPEPSALAVFLESVPAHVSREITITFSRPAT